jgi:hypothetical protein
MRMVGAQLFLSNLQRAAIQRLGGRLLQLAQDDLRLGRFLRGRFFRFLANEMLALPQEQSHGNGYDSNRPAIQ